MRSEVGTGLLPISLLRALPISIPAGYPMSVANPALLVVENLTAGPPGRTKFSPRPLRSTSSRRSTRVCGPDLLTSLEPQTSPYLPDPILGGNGVCLLESLREFTPLILALTGWAHRLEQDLLLCESTRNFGRELPVRIE